MKDWLKVAKVTDDPAGDFVKDARSDSQFPEKVTSLERLRGYLRWRGACSEAIEAALPAWRRYQTWLKRRAR